MKKILLLTLILISLVGFSQKDTLIENLTGYQFEMYNKSMNVNIVSDTIIDADLYFYKNQLAWGNTPTKLFNDYKKISDSLVSLFAPVFEGMIISTGILSYQDMYGIYTLTNIDINYNGGICCMKAIYNKQEKAPNGTLTNRYIPFVYDLTQSQIDVFKQLLLGEEVKALYLDWYNEVLGNN